MVPPRLSVVGRDRDEKELRDDADDIAGSETKQDSQSDQAPNNRDALDPGAGLEIASADGAMGSVGADDSHGGSPVHDLIASLQTANMDQSGCSSAPSNEPDSDAVCQAQDASSIDAVGASVDAACADEPVSVSVEHMRLIEALLFAATEPLSEQRLAELLPADCKLNAALARLQVDYAGRGVNLMRVAGGWSFRTAEDLSWALERHASEQRRLSKAALETLAIVAYHQPVTRAEIEEIRGVSISKGTLDVLMDSGWVRPRGRRRAPGKPVTYGTTESFLSHFNLAEIKDLPGLNELKGAGLLDANLPPDFQVPEPTDVAALMPDELPLEDGDEGELQTELAFDEDDDDVLDFEDEDGDGSEAVSNMDTDLSGKR